MVDALIHIFLLHTLNSLSYHVFVADGGQAHELPRPQGLELPLDHAEHHLDRVVVRLVGEVVDEAELEPLHLCLRSLCRVRREVVHEQGDLLLLILGPQVAAVVLELLDIDRLLEDLVMFYSSLLRNAAQQRQGWLLQLICVHSHVAILVRPFAVRTGLASEHGLIDVDDAEAVVPG